MKQGSANVTMLFSVHTNQTEELLTEILYGYRYGNYHAGLIPILKLI